MKPQYTWEVKAATCVHCGETKSLEQFGFAVVKTTRYRRRMCNKCLSSTKKKKYMNKVLN
jgi:hypothetical protein